MGTATGIISKANRAVTAATTVSGNEIVLVDATSAAATITGPAAATARRWGVKKTDSSTNAVTVSYLNAAGNTATITLAAQDDAKTFEPLGSGYAAVAADRSRALDDARYLLVAQTQQTGTAYTFVLADASTLVESNNAVAVTVTVPPNSSVAYPVGTTLAIRQYGAGQVTIAPGAGVTIRSRGASLKLAGQYSEATLTQRATDEWVLSGDLA